jgi:putative addiction module component (TIGR02574 family)
MTPTATDELPGDLVERVKQLSPRGKEQLLDLLENEIELPPDPRTEEELMAELKRRIEDAESGRVVGLTREEAKEQVRKMLREQHGFEL